MSVSERLSLLSFNVYWDTNENHEQLKSFLSIVNEKKVDFVIIQNISPLYFEKLGREMNYLGYKKVFPDISSKNFLGEIIFTTKEIKRVFFTEHQKNMDHRGVFMVESGNTNYCIGSCRFDRLNYMKYKQLSNMNKMVKNMVGEGKNIILCADINSFDYEEFGIPDNWKDTWYEYGTEKEKYTMDCQKNILCDPPNMDRPDRIWFFSHNDSIECSHYELIKNSPISSHFGIYVVYTMN